MVALKTKKVVPPGQIGLSWRLFTPTTQTRQSLVPSPDSVDATFRKITKNHIAVQSKTTQTPIITNASVTIWKERFLASDSSRRTSLLDAWCQLLVEKHQWKSFLQKNTMRRWKKKYTAEKTRLVRTSAILKSCTEVDKIWPWTPLVINPYRRSSRTFGVYLRRHLFSKRQSMLLSSRSELHQHDVPGGLDELSHRASPHWITAGSFFCLKFFLYLAVVTIKNLFDTVYRINFSILQNISDHSCLLNN